MSPTELDTLVFFFINKNLQNSLFDFFMPLITKKAYYFFLPFILWTFYKDKKNALIILLIAVYSFLLADWTANVLKHYFERIRPCSELVDVRLLVGCGKSFSMPSNHATNVFAFTIPFFIMLKNKVRYILIAIAVIVGFSRIYVGVHYPSDVLVGAIVGSGLSLGVTGLYKWSSKRYKENPYTTVLFIFLLSLSLFRIYYITNGPLDLSPDEAHYWEWSRRLDLSYYSKGPMIAYMIFLGTFIFGDTVLGIRIMAVIFSAMSSYILYILGKNLYDAKVGLFSAILIQFIPLFSAYGVIFTIDSPFIFFWVLSLYLFWKAISEERKEFWPALGLSVGVGLLTKYTMAFFYLCAFLFLLLSKKYRKILFTASPYLSLIISLLVFSPVIIWNSCHDWVTFKHTAGQAHLAEGIRISFKSFFEFLGSQVGVITPFLFVLMIFSTLKLKIKNGLQGNFLFWFSIPLIIFFFLKSLQAKVQANWALTGYITSVIAFSSLYLKNITKVKRVIFTLAIFISIFITLVAHYPSMLNIPIEKDPTSRLRGWKELGAEVSKIYEQMSSNNIFIFSDRYQVSSELAFYVKSHPITYCINLGRRMNQYDLWPGFNHLIGYDAIYVRLGDSKIPERVHVAFDKVEKRLFTAYTKKHAKIRDYSIFLCYNFKGLKIDKPERY